MCTGIRVKSQNEKFYWGRTQEFSMNLPYQGLIIPRKVETKALLNNTKSKYATVGIGLALSDALIDGMNECGLIAGSFNFAEDYVYATEEEAEAIGKIGLRGEEVITWLLLNCQTIEDVIAAAVNKIVVVDTPNQLGMVIPQHYVFQDSSGRSIVLEPSKKLEFNVFENAVGIFTNNPPYDWHMRNLKNYTQINDLPTNEISWDEFSINSKIRGGNLRGIPGDFTAASRFIRASFLTNLTEKPVDDEAIEHVFHLLNSFDIPKGLLKDEDGGSKHHTQYTSAYDPQTKTMSYHHYDNRIIQQLVLTEERITTNKVLRFEIENKQHIIEMQELL